MKRRSLLFVLCTIFFVAVAGCASMQTAQHKYLMRGQVLDVTGDTVYFCTGTPDGAKAGQQLSVYRYENRTVIGQGKPAAGFDRILAGEVKITEVVDEHYARAKVLKGSIKVNDLVGLSG